MIKTKIAKYTKHVASNWMVVVGLTAAGLAAGYGYNNYIQQPLYSSSATLLLVNKADESISASSLVNNYAELFKSRSVLEKALQAEGHELAYETLLANTSATVPENTEVIKVALATNNPESSQGLMSAAVDSFYNQMSTIYGINNLETVDSASLPTTAFNVDTNKQLAFGAISGLLLSMVLLLVTYSGNTASTTAQAQAATETTQSNRRRDRKARKSDNEIILGDDDDLYDSFLFDESILEDLVESENKPAPAPVKKPGSKLRSSNKK